MIIDFYNRGGGGSGSGVTTGQVQTMIDNSISGKADTTAVTTDLASKQNYYTASTLTAVTNPQEGDVCLIPIEYRQIVTTGLDDTFINTVTGHKVKIDYNSSGASSNNSYKARINGQYTWGWGYRSGGTVTATTNSWQSWDGNNYVFEFPSEITGWQNNTMQNMSELWQRSTFYLVLENYSYTYTEGQWVRLQDKLDEVNTSINDLLGDMQEGWQFTTDAPWDELGKPSEAGFLGNDGNIFTNESGITAEVFKQADVWVERKGVYQRSFTASTLSGLTGNEGDVASIITYSSVSVSDFVDMLTGDTWQTDICGHTFKFTADTSVATAEDWMCRIEIGDDSYIWGIDCQGGELHYYDNEGSPTQDYHEWDGSEITITFPEYDSSMWAVSDTPSGVSIFTETDPIQYTMINGEWSKTYKQVMISQADFDLLQTKDPNTIYNITGTTS